MINVMCKVTALKYDAQARVGELHLPGINTPDFSRTIKLFEGIDLEADIIRVYQDGMLHLIYQKLPKGWVAEIITP
jgi:hypothetical protein